MRTYDLMYDEPFKPTPESRRIQSEHEQNERTAKDKGIYVYSDPSGTGGGLLYGPDGYIACISLGTTEPGVTEQRTKIFREMLDRANGSKIPASTPSEEALTFLEEIKRFAARPDSETRNPNNEFHRTFYPQDAKLLLEAVGLNINEVLPK